MDFGLFNTLATATPQGNRTKRARAEGPAGQQEDEGPGMVKLLCRVSSLLLKKDRDQDSRIGTTILLPQDGDKPHGLTAMMKNAKQLYADNTPQREQGKGKPHPWGAPRNANLAAFISYTVEKEYQGPNGEELEKIAKEIWSEKDLTNLTQVLFKMTGDCVKNGNFTPLDPLCEYFTFREPTKDLFEAETIRFIDHVLRSDISIANFIDSDFALLNSSLAKHYRIADVIGPPRIRHRHHRTPRYRPLPNQLSQTVVCAPSSDFSAMATRPATNQKHIE